MQSVPESQARVPKPFTPPPRQTLTPNPTEVAPRAWWDPLAVFGIGAFVYGLLLFWRVPGIHPSVWNDVAAAVGVYPPTSPFPGLYHVLVSGLAALLPLGTVLDALPHLGRLAVAGSAACVYLIFRDILPSTLRLKAHMVRMGADVGRLVAALAAVLFACADPVWRAGQTLTPVSLFLLFATAAVYLFFRFVRRGSISSLYGCGALVGVISAESPLGFVLGACVVAGVLIAVRWANDPDVPLVTPLIDDLMREIVFRRLSYIWACGFVFALLAGGAWFVLQGGLEATGHMGVPGLLYAYLNDAWNALYHASTASGWLFMLLFAVAPFILALKLLPRAWDDDRFLPWSVGVAYVIVGAVAFSQLAGASTLWFWTWFGEVRDMVPSDTLLAFSLLFNVATVAFALAVFGVDAVCRNYRRIAQQRFPESMLAEEPAHLAASLGRQRQLRKCLFWSLVVLVPLLVLPGRVQTLERGMARLIVATLDETLRESEGCTAIFTDGSFDPMLELESIRRGHPLKCLALLAPNTPRAYAIRVRAAQDDEDRELMRTDAASALRTWIGAKPARLETCAVQIGFEMWQRVRKPLPPLLGLVARPGGVDDAARARALEACAALGRDVQALAKEGDADAITDIALRRKYPFVGWRLARLAQMRSRAADEKGDRATAFREAGLAEALDAVNGQVQKMHRDVNWIKNQNGGQLSPREGLVIGLARADFALAGRYAAPVLAADPDDPRANFALGMMYCQDEQFARAELHLSRCLKRRPDDPAVLNNLAIVQTKLGRYDEAEKNARRVLAKYPKLVEAKKTLENVLAARKAAQEKGNAAP